LSSERGPADDPRRWLLYILRCRDGSLYTGITTDLRRRVAQHAAGRAARYTRGRGPFTVVHVEELGDRGVALRRELEVKALRTGAKRRLLRR
jgi:predicted GIY-YIG superfamily endonuclease